MIYLKQAVVVEGKYDKIKLSSFVKTTIVTTEGFRIFKSFSKRNLIKKLAQKNGIVILTDSDRAGQIIRNYVKSFVKNCDVVCAFVPQILGKEKRKFTHSKEGVLGIEGLDEKIIISALKKAGVLSLNKKIDKFTNLNLIEAKLSGCENSSVLRKQFLKKIGMPHYLSNKQLLEVLNSAFSHKQFLNLINLIKNDFLKR